MNFHWLPKTVDVTGLLENSTGVLRQSDLSNYLWKAAPFAWPLGKMLHSGSILRHHSESLKQLEEHMGLGAAVHMSSIAEPASYWLKKG